MLEKLRLWLRKHADNDLKVFAVGLTIILLYLSAIVLAVLAVFTLAYFLGFVGFMGLLLTVALIGASIAFIEDLKKWIRK